MVADVVECISSYNCIAVRKPLGTIVKHVVRSLVYKRSTDAIIFPPVFVVNRRILKHDAEGSCARVVHINTAPAATDCGYCPGTDGCWITRSSAGLPAVNVQVVHEHLGRFGDVYPNMAANIR